MRMRRLSVAAAAVTALLTVAACGGGSSTPTSSSAPAPTTSGAPTTSAAPSPTDTTPIVIGSINTENSPNGSFKLITDAADAYFKTLNDNGGINGRPVNFIRCDDKGDPAKGEDCSRQMVEEGAVAVLGGIAFTSAQLLPILTAAGIPYVGGLTLFASDYEDANFYPITNAGGTQALYTLAWYLLNKNLKKGVVLNADVGEPDMTLAKVIEANGGTVGLVSFPPTAADVSPYVAKALEGNPEFVSIHTDGPNTVRFVTGLRDAGFTGQITALGTSSDPDSLKAMGEKGNGVVFSNFYEDPITSQQPAYVQFRDALAKYGDGTQPSGFALNGYLAAYVTASAIATISGEVTAESTVAALTSVSGLTEFFEPPLNAADAVAEFPRTYYYTAKPLELQSGVLVPAVKEYYNWFSGESLGAWNPS